MQGCYARSAYEALERAVALGQRVRIGLMRSLVGTAGSTVTCRHTALHLALTQQSFAVAIIGLRRRGFALVP